MILLILELGSFSLREIKAVRLPFGLTIERDIGFIPLAPLSVWTETARRSGSILAAERVLLDASSIPLPPDPDLDRP